MKLHVQALVQAVAWVAAVGYAGCALLVALAPQATMRVAGYLFHIDLSGIARPISWVGVLAGMVVWTLGSCLFAGVAARLYNRFAPA